MKQLIIDLFGQGRELTTLQISMRAFVMFFVALLLVRIGGVRIFGKKSAFDSIVSVILGAVLSRGITGAAPFGAVVAAGGVLVIVHRAVALACIMNNTFDRVAKGRQVLLYSDGRLHRKNLAMCSLSENDLMESLRLVMQTDDLAEIDRAYMENNGDISFIEKKKAGQ